MILRRHPSPRSPVLRNVDRMFRTVDGGAISPVNVDASSTPRVSCIPLAHEPPSGMSRMSPARAVLGVSLQLEHSVLEASAAAESMLTCSPRKESFFNTGRPIRTAHPTRMNASKSPTVLFHPRVTFGSRALCGGVCVCFVDDIASYGVPGGPRVPGCFLHGG